MKISARSVLMAGVATLTASAVAIAPSVQPPPPPRPTIQLAADVQLLALQEQPPLLTVLLNSPLALLGPAAPLGTVPPPPAPIQFAIAPNLADTIDSVYIAVEPWVQYGFEVATAVVRWIPYVGWFAGLIMDGYFFGESLVASGVFNFTDWLRGNGGVVENLVDFGVDVGLAFVWLGLDALNSFIPLPPIPLPPRPPLQGPFLASTTLAGPMEAPGVGVENAGSLVRAFLDRVLNNPLNADGNVDGAFKDGAMLSSLIRNGIAEIGDLLGVPSSPPVTPQTGELETMSDIGTVPSTVKTPFAQFNSAFNSVRTGINTEADVDQTSPGPLTEVTKTVRNVRNEIRANFNAATERRTEGAATNGVVRAQGEVRGVVARAVNDVVNAVRAGRPDKAADEVANAPTTVAKSFRDTAKKVVKNVQQAAKDFRDAAKDRAAADDE